MKNISEIHTLAELVDDLKTSHHSIYASGLAPVNVEKIAALYGIAVEDDFRPDFNEQSGMVKGLSIWVNPKDANEYTALRRHIVAHELGHIVLHKRNDGKPQFFQDSNKSIRGDSLSSDPGEEESNEFAAELLIPSHGIELLLESLDADTKPIDLFKRIAEVFDVPMSLVRRRVVSYVNSSAK